VSETELLRRVQVAVSVLGARLFRNHVGLFYTRTGVPVKIGTVGTADLLGWVTITVTPALVGKKLAIFLALEAKSPTGRVTAAQSVFLETVRRAGGIGAVVRSEDDAAQALAQ